MDWVVPAYYKEFQCIASRCRHNCCIGWEIAIDPQTHAYYSSVGGEMGERLRRNITQGEPPCFRLNGGKRCSFLNQDNLCGIYLELGESALCEICKEHPRHYFVYPDRREAGLGLCCEEAARLILGWKPPMELCIPSDCPPTEDDFLLWRGELMALLQDRQAPFWTRWERAAEELGLTLSLADHQRWAAFFLGLEHLEEDWRARLLALREKENLPLGDFARYMAERETEYEQLAVAWLYRYFATPDTEEEAIGWGGFALLATALVFWLGALSYLEQGDFSLEDQVELVRLFSAEIEYSDTNPQEILSAFRLL